MKYKGDQLGAVRFLSSFVNSNKKDATLIGYAGTGKTTLIGPFIKWLNSKKIKTMVATPTHKAKKVILSKINAKHAKVCTIHSALGLVVDEIEEGCIETESNFIRNYQIVIIDECSMLSKELMQYIQNKRGSAKIVYIGDPLQLPPVGDSEQSESFNTGNTFAMSKIIRQEDTNPIITVATHIRKGMSSNSIADIAYDTNLNDKGEGTYSLSIEDTIIGYKRVLESKGDPKILCFKNNTKDDWNNAIRECVLDNPKVPYVNGEKLIMDAPLGSRIQNGQEFVVEKVIGEGTIMGVPVITATVVIDEVSRETINLPKFITEYKDKLATIIHHAKQDKRTTDNWNRYYKLKSKIAVCSYAYAITIHKSQGSTYSHVFLDVQDIKTSGNWNVDLCNKLLYVGFTRSSRLVYLIDYNE